MRVVHSRKQVWEKDYAFEDAFTLLPWILSVMKWKEYGYNTVLYTDKKTLNRVKEFGFDSLYDEINTSYLTNINNIKNIDFYCFWAMPKILSLRAEIEAGYNSIIADTDIVPMCDLTQFFAAQPYELITWSNKEFYELQSIYPRLSQISLPTNYQLPVWFQGKAKPLNTGIIYFKDNREAKNYVNEVVKIATSNKNCNHNSRTQTMCTAEQRMIGEYAKHRNLYLNYIQANNRSPFNENAFHTHNYKAILTSERKIQFNIAFLKQIKNRNEELYNRIINKPLFNKERELINNNIIVKIPEELQQYNW